VTERRTEGRMQDSGETLVSSRRVSMSGEERWRRSQRRPHAPWRLKSDSAGSGPDAGPFGADVSLRLDELHDTVIVTMATVRMVEVAANQIIRVVGVRNRLVPTARGVRVPLIMLLAGVRGGAGCRVASLCLEAALIDVITMGMVEVPLMHVIAVVAVLDRAVSTPRTVGVCMSFMRPMFCHVLHSLRRPQIIPLAQSPTPGRHVRRARCFPLGCRREVEPVTEGEGRHTCLGGSRRHTRGLGASERQPELLTRITHALSQRFSRVVRCNCATLH
jgi:hypothetical protein